MAQLPEALKTQAEDEAKRHEVLMAYAAWPHGVSGSVVLKDLKASLDQPSYRLGGNKDDALYREGRRSVWLDILAAIEAGQSLVENLGKAPANQQAQAELGDLFE